MHLIRKWNLLDNIYRKLIFHRSVSCRRNLPLDDKASFVRTDMYLTDEHHMLRQGHDL